MPDIADPLILIVDDDAAHAASVRDLLSAHRYPATTITDSSNVLRALAECDYHVLLLDLNMPGMTGLEILEELQQSDANVKTIVLSGESKLSLVTPILRLGAHDYLTKPYEPQQLLTSVENALIQTRLERDNDAMTAEAEASRTLHRFLLNASPDLIYMLDEHGRFRYLNERLEDVFGRSVTELEGRPWQALLGTELAEALAYRFNERRTGSRATRNLEFDFTTATGDRRVFEFSATGLYDEPRRPCPTGYTGTYGALRDVTDARRTTRELALSQEKFYGLFMESPDAVFIARLADGTLIESNDRFRAIKTRLAAIDSPDIGFIFDTPAEHAQFVAALNGAGEQLRYQLQRHLPEETLHFEISARRLDIDEEACVLAVLRDRTAEHRAEMDRLFLQKQLQQASKMEAIGQLAGGIAHDFNNILASIIGYAELVRNSRERLAGAKLDGYLEEVVTAGHRARDLISQMLTFTRANRGDPCPVNVRNAITDVSRMLRAAIPNTIDLETRLSDDLADVMADPVQLQQIIINLMINARDAIGDRGRIEIRASRGSQPAPCVCCRKTLEEEHIVLSVADSGGGIEPKLHEKVFEMYFTVRERGRGAGIGLWLIDNLVHEYGGHITLTSATGAGSTFSIHLPMAGAEAGREVPDRGEPLPLEGRIVVVDDEVSVGGFIGEVLRDHGYDVVVFNESPEALRYLEEHGDEVALLLTDQLMPLVSGLELTERAKALIPTLPVILITAVAANRDGHGMAQLGVNRFLGKPFRIDELLKTIEELTSPTNKERASTPAATAD